ncbi:hypothetical protein GCM10022408_37870 [Hymenobacter fastidiosus]|uniref:Uncharacterized protein n=2 Tax=Hymenobacter fastidiosus TaxID=486264 RepID=A0ABP7T382_9BACT
MRRREFPAACAESFLTAWAGSGYLVLSVTEDVAPGGDTHFLQTRCPPAPLLSAAAYWQRHEALHERLRRSYLLHMPIGLGPDAAGPLSLAWLVPAPSRGTLQVGAYQQPAVLSREQRAAWLAWLAKQLSQGHAGTGQRVLVQPPGADTPAYWHYGTYAGDALVPGTTCSERLRTLLTHLPRYARNATEPGLLPDSAEAAAWPFLVNTGVGGFHQGNIRVNGHKELLTSGMQPGHTHVGNGWW